MGPQKTLKGLPMKSITEFWNHTLLKGLDQKTALTAEGKTPEEVTAAIGESFKYEGDKLKHFVAALDVAGANKEKLSRVLVVSLAEGEALPPKGVKVEEHVYLPDFQIEAKKPITEKKVEGKGGNNRNRGGQKKDGGGKGKESPWGLSPEQLAEKKNRGKASAKPS
jgi:hypothetical protein